ncbi:hypothetical protein ACIBKX_13495 [Streptomyces sp. NPDC050658]|uniref:hypothetical protein n=1 Tax=unclassified Streptomyces TaxID=2593676 RepID=UPI00341C48D7
MKYVKADWDPEFRGFLVDALDYVESLPELRPQLPPGAWEYVSEEGHYDYASPTCVKDLELGKIQLPVATAANTATANAATASIRFLPNLWKHPAGLRIEYTGVTHFSVEYHHSIDWIAAIAVLLDEVRPAGGAGEGIVHEIEFTDATIVVRCADLVAVWGVEA